MRTSKALRGLLLSSALFTAQGVWAQSTTEPQPEPAAAAEPAGDQEPASETAGEGDAKAQGEAAVPTNEGIEPERRSLEAIVVTGRITYRNRTRKPARYAVVMTRADH